MGEENQEKKENSMTTRTKRTTLSVIEVDDSITLGRRQWEQNFRDRLSYEREKMLTQAMNTWRSNPIARRIIELTTEFTVGNGMRFTCPHPAAEAFLQAFWSHPLNALDEQIPEWADEAWRSGDLFILFSLDAGGMPYVRAIPSENITEIQRRENDYRQEVAYLRGFADQEPYAAYDPETAQESFVLHFPLNRPVGACFGESDLVPLLYWIDLYRAWLEDRARQNHFRQQFAYVLQRKFASQAEKDAYLRSFSRQIPRQTGGVLLLDPEESLTTVFPNLAAYEAGEDGLALKRMIATGAGIPLHYLAEPEGSTRTTAEAAGTPAFRRFKRRQEYLCLVVRRVLEVALSLRRRVEVHIPAQVPVEVSAADVTERDNATLALAAQRIVSALAPLYNAKLMDAGELLRLVYRFIAEAGPAGKEPEGGFVPINARSPKAPREEPVVSD
jgi:hypothetical protein